MVKKSGVLRHGINIQKAEVTLVGTSPLLQQNKPMDVKSQKHKLTDDETLKQHLYSNGNGKLLHPSRGIKKAMAAAAGQKYFVGRKFTKKSIYGSIFIYGVDREQDFEIIGEPELMKYVTRNQTGQLVDVSCAKFVTWSAKLLIRFDADRWNLQEIANMLERAGYSIGIGCQRPENGGTYGQFEVG